MYEGAAAAASSSDWRTGYDHQKKQKKQKRLNNRDDGRSEPYKRGTSGLEDGSEFDDDDY